LPTNPAVDDAAREMEDAFEEDDADDNESTPLSRTHHEPQQQQFHSSQIPGAYDFERDYDYTMPPPGSPPGPSTTALPNNYGNSNGLIPTAPVVEPPRGPSFFRRAVGAVLPTHYQRIATEAPSARTVGGGVENDGVFANVMAKPVRGARTVRTTDGSIYLAPEETQKEAPPTYAEAQTDSVPPYWETTVVTPDGDFEDLIVHDLPTGSLLIFAFNLFTSFFFQFLGFVITYFLATTHAAKYGSRAGLGLTLIQYGAYWRVATSGPPDGESEGQGMMSWNETTMTYNPVDPSGSGYWNNSTGAGNATAPQDYSYYGDFGWNGKDWVALVFMTFGWLLLFSSAVGFWRVKRWEASIRASSQPVAAPTVEDIQRDIQVRRNIELVFGFGQDEAEDATEEEARLASHLRAAGLI